MDILANLALGFGVAVTLKSLAYCFIGVFLGTLIGVLPGIGPVATVAMLLPLTFNLDPATSMIMLAGIYYGAQYGGSTTAILVNIPGETSSVVTTLDGYQMARHGRAGPALGIAAIGSFVAGTVATLVVALFSPPLAELALKFRPGRLFLADGVRPGRRGRAGARLLRKAIAMVVLGLLLGLVGTDVNSGVMRFTFGIPALAEGISFVALAMGMFGIAEVDLQPGAARQGPRGLHVELGPRAAEPRRPAAKPHGRSCAAPRSARSSESCRAAARCSPRSRPTPSRRRSPSRRAISATATSAAWPRRNPPIMPARRPRSSRC